MNRRQKLPQIGRLSVMLVVIVYMVVSALVWPLTARADTIAPDEDVFHVKPQN